MYVVELHDDDTTNGAEGTLVDHIGRNIGGIDYVYQVEGSIQEEIEQPWRRAYLKAGNEVLAVWAHDPETGEMQYVARAEGYMGEWELPFVTTPDARIAVSFWTDTGDAADTWAANALSDGAVTAILLGKGEIRCAWELVDEVPTLIARGPRVPK